MDARAWLVEYHRRFPLPEDYLALDVESTGLSTEEDLAVQVGYVLVQGGVAQDRVSVLLDWEQTGRVSGAEMEYRLARVERSIRRSARGPGRFRITAERLRREGVHPRPVLAALAGLVDDCRAERVALVMHNGYRMDAPLLESCWRRLGLRGSFGDDWVDTGAIEKASQTGALPRRGEPLGRFCRRVLASRSAVKWSLSGHCVARYGLDRGLDPTAAHDAGHDAELTHRLLEHYRGLLRPPERGAA